ncbi:MAG: TetR/AcrR family transcriptional regulator [Betaproteobacteria bacterium]|nr:TetR/AcrR family transcriptional regulator [Betaproteobacteria bacterium]
MVTRSRPSSRLSALPSALHSTRAKARAPATVLTVPDALAGLPVPASTCERILFAAVSVLFEEGFASLTQQRVCEKAGVRQSHLTYYFPTRNDLLREAAAFGCEAMFNQITQGIDAGRVTPDNLRVTLNADITDRRWARLMNALIAASDEDASIKPWLAAFDEQIRLRLLTDLGRLGLAVTLEDIETLHATFVGAIQMDLGESTDASLGRAQRVIGRALDRLLVTMPPTRKRKSAKSTPLANARKPGKPE